MSDKYCEICKDLTMKITFVNEVKESGYSKIIKLTCSQCDISYMKVA